MIEEIKLGADAVIYTSTSEGEYHNVEGKSVERIILDEFEYGIKLKTWHCKICKLDNQGVICSECKKWWNPADPDCYIKE